MPGVAIRTALVYSFIIHYKHLHSASSSGATQRRYIYMCSLGYDRQFVRKLILPCNILRVHFPAIFPETVTEYGP